MVYFYIKNPLLFDMKTLKILLIEDDMIEIMKLNRVISTLKLPHKLMEANNGEDALNLLKEKDNIPDIILLDLNMPKINGIEFLKILKKIEIFFFV
jgi:CheY-like chemotaxis protein